VRRSFKAVSEALPSRLELSECRRKNTKTLRRFESMKSFDWNPKPFAETANGVIAQPRYEAGR
jgi:hypothetical protein